MQCVSSSSLAKKFVGTEFVEVEEVEEVEEEVIRRTLLLRGETT